ncbi:hypothetical protein [Myceligenerans pegani]|uniref:Septum formation-related domain-containing protein n=1 Tax=Myceligenerans pegani TaxID=2776917 RepID=A0ABR9MTH0_9MICO|nr:hypothetical protein [Myceligenerans sp. TRM 65318]MBE1874664.1 hypothetical protein [Myceligenerans sp. TRM 65318]MBE3016935.1 hypothetical protein [Myceligenerans sp. TRM 65318]
MNQDAMDALRAADPARSARLDAVDPGAFDALREGIMMSERSTKQVRRRMLRGTMLVGGLGLVLAGGGAAYASGVLGSVAGDAFSARVIETLVDQEPEASPSVSGPVDWVQRPCPTGTDEDIDRMESYWRQADFKIGGTTHGAHSVDGTCSWSFVEAETAAAIAMRVAEEDAGPPYDRTLTSVEASEGGGRCIGRDEALALVEGLLGPDYELSPTALETGDRFECTLWEMRVEDVQIVVYSPATLD